MSKENNNLAERSTSPSKATFWKRRAGAVALTAAVGLGAHQLLNRDEGLTPPSELNDNERTEYIMQPGDTAEEVANKLHEGNAEKLEDYIQDQAGEDGVFDQGDRVIIPNDQINKDIEP